MYFLTSNQIITWSLKYYIILLFLMADDCSCILYLIIFIFKLLTSSFRWKTLKHPFKRSWPSWAYLSFTLVQILGSVFILIAGDRVNSLLLHNVSIFLIIWIALFSVSMFANICIALFYLLIKLYSYISIAIFVAYTWKVVANKYSDTWYFIFVITGLIMIFLGYCSGLFLSYKYHWVIYKSGSDLLITCYTLKFCIPQLCYCWLCCANRKIRTKFNVVRLYHNTNRDAARSILEHKVCCQ